MIGQVVLPDVGAAQLARRVVASINAIARRGRAIAVGHPCDYARQRRAYR